MAKLRLHVFAVSFFRGENACAEWGEGCCGKMGWERAVYGEMLTQKAAPERARSTFSQKA